MSVAELEIKENAATAARRFVVPLAIFGGAFLVYYLSTYLATRELLGWCSGDQVKPGCWYQHYVYLTEAILNGTLDVKSAGMPDFYQDSVTVGDAKYLPFPPGPAVLLMPFVAIWGTDFSEIFFSMALGAANVVLFWYLLRVLNISSFNQWLLVPFFAFGTAQFYSATTGTVWFFGHVAAIFFVLAALIFLFKRANPLIPAVLMGFAFMSREPTVLATPVFLYVIFRQKYPAFSLDSIKEALRDRETIYRLGMFCAGMLPFVFFFFWYNVARFDGLFDTGYHTVYNGYIQGNMYSFYRRNVPADTPHYELFDLRNIPLHLYTMFLMAPDYLAGWTVVRPNPYGMSVLLTSPAFIYAFLVKRQGFIKPAMWVSALFVAVPLFLHYSQGWVQFGYRFLLDFAPFLLVLTALGFEDNDSPASRRWKIALVVFSVFVGFWGRYWANKLGW